MIVLALAGPLLAGGAWAVLLPWPVARRAVGGGLALVANAAAWSVFWSAYRGDPASWRSFEAGLLGATVAATAEIGIIVAATRVERVEPRAMPAAVAALAVMASAVLAAAYAQSAAVLAVVIPLPTLAVAAVGAARRIRDLRGVAGLAAADIAALAGLTVLHARIDSVALISADFLVVGLLLAAAAVKVGAIPGLATWRLTDESGSVLAAGLRGQGLVLAAVAGVVLFRGEPEPIVAAVAAAAVALCGLATMVARTAPAALAAATGAACAVPFVALGLGGGAGVRAFLVLVPPLLLGAAAAWVLIPRDPDPAQPAPAAASGGEARSGLPVWMGAVTLGVILGSLLGAPPGGGFPGTWLTLALATARGESDPATLLIAGAVAAGLTISFLGVVSVIPAARPSRAAALLGAVVAAVLVYVGTQPVRLGIGWWLRVEAEAGTPHLLPAAGAPDLPAIGGPNLLLALVPAAVLVGLVIVRGGGLRDTRATFLPMVPKPVSLPAPVRSAVTRIRNAQVGLGVAGLFGLVAIILAARLVILAGRGGFL